MIAKVKIAPVERWCKEARENCYPDLAGREVLILTHECSRDLTDPPCGGMEWIVEQSWATARNIEIGRAPGERVAVCEHMLEMD